MLARATSHPAGIEGTAIRGPEVAVRAPNPNDGIHTGPAYRLIVAEYSNPGSASVDAWVDSIRKATNARIAADDPDSLSYLAAPDTLRVGSERALRLQPFCGDCQPEEIYLASPRRRVFVSILYDLSIPGDREAQRRLYDAILGTFRWTQ